VKRLIGALLVTLLAGVLGPFPLSADVEVATPADGSADRELIVRFARAYGMALGTAPDGEEEDAVRDPEALPGERREELEQILREGGLSVEEWRGMFARMDADAELRDRIDSLSVPFRIR
jgi:hypothetical protein